MRKARRRRRLSMTSLIDVIFLLLLFFMLSSTFTRFAEVDLDAAGSGAQVAADTRPLFLQLSPDRLSLNGADTALEDLPATLAERIAAAEAETATPLIIALRGEVTAQRLTDVLVALRGITGLRATVLGAG